MTIERAFYSMTKFYKWVVNQGGQSALASILDVRPQTVSAWCRGVARPRIGLALKLITLSRGHLSLNDIYRDCGGTRAKNG